MKQWAELENQMVSFERALEYVDLESEEKSIVVVPSESWPEKGAITINGLNLKYNEKEPYVLKNINVKINAGEKVGIVGRTGSGKSSLIATLLRLVDFEGDILIDCVSIRNLSTNKVRSKISIIPQGSVLFSGSVRQNLDPENEIAEETLKKALEDVGLIGKDFSVDLNYSVSEGGLNLSLGQRQLICLARAIVRKNKILILDEATANIDPMTDDLIQSVIRKKFNNCTVLTIAHKINTILDSDRILVVDSGSVVQFDKPSTLLQDEQGIFYSMSNQNKIDE